MDSNSTIAWLTTHCRAQPIAEKWLLVEHLRTGQQWKDRLTRSGCWHVNLHAKTMRLLVQELAATWLAQESLIPLGRQGLELVVDSVVKELLEQNCLCYFKVRPSAHHALSRLLARTYHDWQLAGLADEDLHDQALEVTEKAHDLRRIFLAIRQRLAASQQADYADCIRGILHTNDHHSRLPPGLTIMQPEMFPLTKLERDLLGWLQGQQVNWLQPDSPSSGIQASNTSTQASVRMSQLLAVGEINEVRGWVQHCLTAQAKPMRLDEVEVLVSDYARYGPLILEGLLQWLPELDSNQADKNPASTIDALPLTFAEGLACIYSRPGRLLRSWIRWAESDYLQSRAVQILREGLLKRPTAAEDVGYARLASTLRRVPIGFGLERYMPQIDSALAAARRDAARRSSQDYGYVGDCGSGTLQALQSVMQPLIQLAPKPQDSPLQLLHSAKRLLQELARSETILDRYARSKLIDDIEGMIALVQQQPQALANVRAWLEELPMQSRLLASTPRPGCVHVAPIEQGGATGRPLVYMLGLDDRKFPKKPPVDPILLDAERTRLSPDLTTSVQLAAHHTAAVQRVVTRLEGIPDAHIIFLRTQQDWSDDSECFASPVLNHWVLPAPVNPISFIAQSAQQTITPAETDLRALLVQADDQARQAQLLRGFPRILRQRAAVAAQQQPTYGPYDGLVPQAGVDLLAAATSRPMSPSRLEMLGSCPRKYFFARALGIMAPEEYQVDTSRWLSALDVGTLLHDVFETFWGQLLAKNQMLDPDQHAVLLEQILADRIRQTAERIPAPNGEAFERQSAELRDYCEIFLQKEHEYIAIRHARPWLMEVSLGSSEHAEGHLPTEIDSADPIEIELTSGRKLRLCGRIDRIDQLSMGEQTSLLIWDYKTGSDWSFDPADAMQQGRKLQPLLYTRMLARRLEQLDRHPESIAGFGYFFPSPRTEGRRIEWSTDSLVHGEPVLEAMLDMLQAGTFIATNEADDCTYCDYQSVCGQAQTLVAISNLKSDCPQNAMLGAWRRCRPSSTKRKTGDS